MTTLQREIAGSARFAGPGGGIQIRLPLPVETLEVLGLSRELDQEGHGTRTRSMQRDTWSWRSPRESASTGCVPRTTT